MHVCSCGRRGAGAGAPESLKSLRDEFLYMKLFKDVLQCDVDMLLPGSRIKFTWFDYVSARVRVAVHGFLEEGEGWSMIDLLGWHDCGIKARAARASGRNDPRGPPPPA